MGKQYGFIIDTERCVDCRACVTACKAANQLELGVTWRRVTTVWKGTYPEVSFTSTSMSCNHCEKPACLDVCPASAISKRNEDGVVVVDRAKCIACGACGEACPFGAPKYGKDGLMQKCNLCLERTLVGKEPVCVTTCSANALTFGSMDELAKHSHKPVRQIDGPTRPSVFIPLKS